MALTSDNILLGSGSLYFKDWSAISASEKASPKTIKSEANRLGDIKGGATLAYGATFYEAKDDLIRVKKTILTDEDIKFKTGIITFNNDTLAALASTAVNEEVTAPTSSATGLDRLKLGGLTNYSAKEYLFYYEHIDGIHSCYFRGSFASGFNLQMAKENETQIDLEITCNPFDPSATPAESHCFFFEEVTPKTT